MELAIVLTNGPTESFPIFQIYTSISPSNLLSHSSSDNLNT